MTHNELACGQTSPNPRLSSNGGMNIRITITNTFHQTATTVVAKSYSSKHKSYTINRDQVKAAMKRLCGIKTCLCGGEPHTRYHVGRYTMEPTPGGGFRFTSLV